MQVDLTEQEQLSKPAPHLLLVHRTRPRGLQYGGGTISSSASPDLARGLVQIIQDAHATNARFKRAFASFFALCRGLAESQHQRSGRLMRCWCSIC